MGNNAIQAQIGRERDARRRELYSVESHWSSRFVFGTGTEEFIDVIMKTKRNRSHLTHTPCAPVIE